MTNQVRLKANPIMVKTVETLAEVSRGWGDTKDVSIDRSGCWPHSEAHGAACLWPVHFFGLCSIKKCLKKLIKFVSKAF